MTKEELVARDEKITELLRTPCIEETQSNIEKATDIPADYKEEFLDILRLVKWLKDKYLSLSSQLEEVKKVEGDLRICITSLDTKVYAQRDKIKELEAENERLKEELSRLKSGQ